MLAVRFPSGTGLTLDSNLVGGGNWQLCCEEPALNFGKIKYLVLTAGLTAGVGGFISVRHWTQGRTVNMNMVKILAVLDCSCWESNVYILIYTLLVYLYAWTCCLIIGGELCIELFFFFFGICCEELRKIQLGSPVEKCKGMLFLILTPKSCSK